jgi:hypothetical protein
VLPLTTIAGLDHWLHNHRCHLCWTRHCSAIRVQTCGVCGFCTRVHQIAAFSSCVNSIQPLVWFLLYLLVLLFIATWGLTRSCVVHWQTSPQWWNDDCSVCRPMLCYCLCLHLSVCKGRLPCDSEVLVFQLLWAVLDRKRLEFFVFYYKPHPFLPLFSVSVQFALKRLL